MSEINPEVVNDYSSDSSYSSDSDIEMKPKMTRPKKDKIGVINQPVTDQPIAPTIKPKRKYTQKPKTPEQKQILIDRLAKAREAKANKKVTIQPYKETPPLPPQPKEHKERKERKEVHHHYHTQAPIKEVNESKPKFEKPKLERSRQVQQQHTTPRAAAASHGDVGPRPSRYTNVGFD